MNVCPSDRTAGLELGFSWKYTELPFEGMLIGAADAAVARNGRAAASRKRHFVIQNSRRCRLTACQLLEMPAYQCGSGGASNCKSGADEGFRMGGTSEA